ncbi:MAG: formylglycine-generating enzyme family protein [Nitrospirae bacterium]|nr:formylglycine-generating enzyme family protein [Nitrospirota bacterium]
MVRVPAGEFIMGTDEQDLEGKAAAYGIMKSWFNDEHPAHTVNLPAYDIDQHEITQAEYRVFVQNTGRTPPPDWVNGQFPPAKARHPVDEVTWEDANAYCLWAGKRLPTEAEWEKAARGPKGLKYPWGDAFDETRANVNGQVGDTTEVGHYEKGKSPYGAYDMIGNVWEWTADWYKPYPGNPYAADEFGEKVKVLRGNSWAGLGHFPPKIYNEVKAHYSRAGYRLFMTPEGRVNDAGFRCAQSAK